jgi:tungstate transport system ATP-binding protein
VTHNVFQAKRLADRAMMMLDGEVIEVAEPAKILENPDDPRTQAFVRGEMVC